MEPETVLFLGDGASQRAGYPLASKLLPAVEKAALSTPMVQFKEAWHGAFLHDLSGSGGQRHPADRVIPVNPITPVLGLPLFPSSSKPGAPSRV